MDRSADTPAALPTAVRVVNVGLPLFAEAVRAQGAEAVDVDWRIPAGGRPDVVAALTRLAGPRHERVRAANEDVLRRLDGGRPLLVGVARAGDAVPGLGGRMLLHSGPAVAWPQACDPLRRSAAAATVAEGWAADVAEADGLLARGAVRLEPANAHDTVLPMAATLGPSAPVLIVEDASAGTRAYSALNQGPGAAPWLGVDSAEAIARLHLLRDAVAPALAAALRSAGPVDVFSLVAQGLQMGDDAHMRFQATTNLLWRHLLPHLVGVSSGRLVEVARFLSANHLFFLNIAMAGAKAVLMSAYDVEASSVVVGMSRNGTTFGLRLAGTGAEEFLAPAPAVGNALYHPGFGDEAAAPDIGDSSVLELVGLGSAASAASPAVAAFLGGSIRDAAATSEAFGDVCVGRSSQFRLPLLDQRGSPLGVDACAVAETEVAPTINTGILHASDGVGQIGAGMARAPLDCFYAAVLALDRRLR